MNVITSKPQKPRRTVADMKPNEAFQIGMYWYIPISMDEDSIGRDYGDFWETHAEHIPGYPPPLSPEAAVPCFRLPSSSFVYLDPDIEVSSYGVPTVTVALS